MIRIIELQFLNKILSTGDWSVLYNNGLSREHFVVYSDEYGFIHEHVIKYGKVPDKITLIDNFNDFSILEVNEGFDYLVQKLKEGYLFRQLAETLNNTAELVNSDVNGAFDYIVAQLRRIDNNSNVSEYDIMAKADLRMADYLKRKELKGLLGIKSGMAELDAITNGWMKEDLVTVVARTNEGKSWLMLYWLINAWKDGKRVLLYSGEMSEIPLGYRIDTFLTHISNIGLMTGQITEQDEQNYFDKMRELGQQNSTPFIVITPKNLGGKRLDCNMLRGLIDKYKPDVVGIDQLSLMHDYRAEKHDPLRVRYTHIAEDLFNISEYYGIPVINVTQANRNPAQGGRKKDNTPELVDVSESDGIVQNSTRVISIKQVGGSLKISIRKNRYGINNVNLMYFWDIDLGQFDYSSGDQIAQSQENIESKEIF